jgi:hypothetical protein
LVWIWSCVQLRPVSKKRIGPEQSPAWASDPIGAIHKMNFVLRGYDVPKVFAVILFGQCLRRIANSMGVYVVV